MKRFFLPILVLIFSCLQISHCGVPYIKTNVVPGEIYNSKTSNEQKLYIYCYDGMFKHLFNIWQTAYITINLTTNQYELYKSSSVGNVLEMHENHKFSWAHQLMSWKSDKIYLDPFKMTCVGIDTKENHKIVATIIRIDFWRIVWLAVGIVWFLASPNLSGNPVFYYICGISLGITFSIIFLLYLLGKFIPKKPALAALFVSGWAVGVYLFQLHWDHLKSIATTYQTHLLMYMVVTGLISFVVCYRFGPVTDPRSKNLIKWTMQAASLILIFYSSKCEEASVTFILILLLYYNFSAKWALTFFNVWTKSFSKKRKFLTEDEYHEEGVRETVKALNDLRKYCSSNECNQWKTVLSLQKPIRYKKSRFAQFMEGSPHLEDSEILAYESHSHKSPLLTDDSDSDEEI